METVLGLFLVSSLLGFSLAYSSWIAITISGLIIAIVSAAVLHNTGFDSVKGIVIIVACLVINQLSYFIGMMLVNRRNRSRLP
jgi:hypothetical protein